MERNTTLEFKITDASRERGHFFWKSEKIGPRLYRNTCLCGESREGEGSALFNAQLSHLQEFIPGYEPLIACIDKDIPQATWQNLDT